MKVLNEFIFATHIQFVGNNSFECKKLGSLRDYSDEVVGWKVEKSVFEPHQGYRISSSSQQRSHGLSIKSVLYSVAPWGGGG
jgi:hypothetical protein